MIYYTNNLFSTPNKAKLYLRKAGDYHYNREPLMSSFAHGKILLCSSRSTLLGNMRNRRDMRVEAQVEVVQLGLLGWIYVDRRGCDWAVRIWRSLFNASKRAAWAAAIFSPLGLLSRRALTNPLNLSRIGASSFSRSRYLLVESDILQCFVI